MTINLDCKKPKYASGKYTITTLEGLFNWLTTEIKTSRAAPGIWIYSLVKTGQWEMSSARYHVEMSTERGDYDLVDVTLPRS